VNESKAVNDIFKRFEFDLTFKYNPAYFLINDRSELYLLWIYVTKFLKISTNEAYIDHLLYTSAKFKAFSCIFYIDFLNRRSDVYSKSYAIERKNLKMEMTSTLPEYFTVLATYKFD